MPLKHKPNGDIAKGSGGRPAGSRNKLQGDFIAALSKHFAEQFAAPSAEQTNPESNGEAAIRLMFVEKPHEYLKLVASLMPKEFDVTAVTLEGLSDAELIEFAENLRALRDRANAGKGRGGKDSPGDSTESVH